MPALEKATAEIEGFVRDAMCDQVVTVSPKTSALEAAELLSENNMRHAIVVDGDRHVVGVVSQRDILKHFIQSMGDQARAGEGGEEYAPWEVGSLIRREPVTVLPDVSLANAGLVLTSAKIGCLPVVDDEKRFGSSMAALKARAVMAPMPGTVIIRRTSVSSRAVVSTLAETVFSCCAREEWTASSGSKTGPSQS